MTHFILMLTRNDKTVADARDVYEHVREEAPTYVGFKDIGLPIGDLRGLTERIHADGRKALLEVVSTGKDEELKSVRAALEMNVDYLLGGRHVTETVALLQGSGIGYFPFCGETVGHPTRLRGSVESIVADARRLAATPGVDGLDLLSYRFAGDAAALTKQVVQAVEVPVIAAGSIDRWERVRMVCSAGVWGFTIGSALFEGRFAKDLLRQQIASLVQSQGVSA